MEKIYWTMKDGQKIDVDKMTESHLRNTLKMILRNRENRERSEYISMIHDLRCEYDAENYGDRD